MEDFDKALYRSRSAGITKALEMIAGCQLDHVWVESAYAIKCYLGKMAQTVTGAGTAEQFVD